MKLLISKCINKSLTHQMISAWTLVFKTATTLDFPLCGLNQRELNFPCQNAAMCNRICSHSGVKNEVRKYDLGGGGVWNRSEPCHAGEIHSHELSITNSSAEVLLQPLPITRRPPTNQHIPERCNRWLQGSARAGWGQKGGC